MAVKYICDFLPYRKSNAAYRTLAAKNPEDWTGTALTVTSDDTTRYAVLAANGATLWSPPSGSGTCFMLVKARMIPGTFDSCYIRVNAEFDALIDVVTGVANLYKSGTLLASGSLGSGVWRSSSDFEPAWIQLIFNQLGSPTTGASLSIAPVSNAGAVSGFVSYTGSTFTYGIAWSPGFGRSGSGGKGAFDYVGLSDGSGLALQDVSPRSRLDPAYYDKWLKLAHAASAPRVMTAELFVPGYDGSNVTNYTTAVLRAATVPYNSGSTWPFDNQAFAEAIVDFPEFSRALPAELLGRQNITAGDLVIANPNGVRDNWLLAKANKAVVTLRYGDRSWPFYDLATVFTGEVTDVTDEPGAIRMKLRDTMSRYDKPVARGNLVGAGNNTGKPIPISAGLSDSVTPVLIDSATLTYRIGEANIKDVAVFDKGVGLIDSAFTLISYNVATKALRTSVAHGMVVGDAVSWASGSLPSPLTTGTNYFVQSVPTSDTFTVSATYGGAVITLSGTNGEQVATVTLPGTDVIRFGAAHNFAANDLVKFTTGCPSPLVAGNSYYVSATNLTTTEASFSLTSGGAVIDLTATTKTESYAGFSFWGYGSAHGYANNDEIVTGPTTTGTPPIAANTRYWVFAINTVEHGFRNSNGGAQIAFSGVGGIAGTTTPNASGYSVYKPLSTVGALLAVIVDAAAATFRLVRNPAGQITCTLRGQSFGGATYTGSAVEALKVLVGASDPLISTQLQTNGTNISWRNRVGVWVDQPANLADLIDWLALSCVSAWGTNRLGTLIANILDADFSATPTATITDDLVDPSNQLRLTAKLLPVDRYEGASVGYDKNYTPQSQSDLAGVINANVALVQYLARKFAISTLNLGGSGNLAGLDLGEKGERRRLPMFETALELGSQAAYHLSHGILCCPKQMGVFTLTVSWQALNAFQVGKQVRIKTSRYGINPSVGKNFLVTAVSEKFTTGQVSLTLLTDLDGYFPVTT